MHKACRFRNAKMIDLLLKNKIGDIMQRNKFGRLPLEQPHNEILNDLKIKNVFEEFLVTNTQYNDCFHLRKEPDYMFVVNRNRQNVLTDQLEAINLNY